MTFSLTNDLGYNVLGIDTTSDYRENEPLDTKLTIHSNSISLVNKVDEIVTFFSYIIVQGINI